MKCISCARPSSCIPVACSRNCKQPMAPQAVLFKHGYHVNWCLTAHPWTVAISVSVQQSRPCSADTVGFSLHRMHLLHALAVHWPPIWPQVQGLQNTGVESKLQCTLLSPSGCKQPDKIRNVTKNLRLPAKPMQLRDLSDPIPSWQLV